MLLRKKNAGNRAQQKLVRHDLRVNYEFNISDFNEPGKAFGEEELQAAIRRGAIEILDDATIAAMKAKRARDKARDEAQRQKEAIAEGVAKRDKARIVPTGLYALNRLGFSTQIPMNIQYLTDGSNRKLTLYNGATIEFKHTAPKNLAFNSQLAMLLTFAFKSLGKDNITDEILAHTKELLAKDKSQGVKQDYKLMPAWVSSIIKSLYEE